MLQELTANLTTATMAEKFWMTAHEHAAYIHCASENTSPFICDKLISQMTSNFANSWLKHTPGNLKQRRQIHSPPHLDLYVRAVPCKIGNILA